MIIRKHFINLILIINYLYIRSKLKFVSIEVVGKNRNTAEGEEKSPIERLADNRSIDIRLIDGCFGWLRWMRVLAVPVLM